MRKDKMRHRIARLLRQKLGTHYQQKREIRQLTEENVRLVRRLKQALDANHLLRIQQKALLGSVSYGAAPEPPHAALTYEQQIHADTAAANAAPLIPLPAPHDWLVQPTSREELARQVAGFEAENRELRAALVAMRRTRLEIEPSRN